MHKGILLVRALMIGGAMFSIGCKDDDGNSPTQPEQAADVVGQWRITEEGLTGTITFSADSTYSFAVSQDVEGEQMPMYNESGTYTVSGKSVTMTGSQCSALGMAADCGDPRTGTVEGDKLTFMYEGEAMVLTRQ